MSEPQAAVPPYPEPEPGTKIRWLVFPCGPPDRTAKPMTAKRRDGKEISIRRSLGFPDDPGDDDLGVRDWRDAR